MPCTCDYKCRDRHEMRARHGTPEAFEKAVLRNVPVFISSGEARAAIARYKHEYETSPELAEPIGDAD
jgi:hypothetical protein